MRTIGDRAQRDIRRADLISPTLSLGSFLLGAFVAYLNRTPAFLVFCALASMFTLAFLAYLLVKMYRQRPHDPTAP